MIYFKRLGLDYPNLRSPKISKQDIQKKEDQLTEYFLYEMRKKAPAAK